MTRPSPAKSKANQRSKPVPSQGKQYLQSQASTINASVKLTPAKDAVASAGGKKKLGAAGKNKSPPARIVSQSSARTSIAKKRKTETLQKTVDDEDNLHDTSETASENDEAKGESESDKEDFEDDDPHTPKSSRAGARTKNKNSTQSSPASEADGAVKRKKSATQDITERRHSLPAKRLRLLSTPADATKSVGRKKYATTHSTGKKQAEQEYLLQLSRDGPTADELEEQEELLSYLPGYHFPSRASKVKAKKLAGHDEDNEELKQQDLAHTLQLIRVMLNVAYMRYPFCNPRSGKDCHELLIHVFGHNFYMSDYEMYNVLRTHWHNPLRQHLRFQRRQELQHQGHMCLWEDIFIEYRMYFRNIGQYFLGPSAGGGIMDTQSFSQSNLSGDSNFILPPGCRFSDTYHIFNECVDSMWIRTTGAPFDQKSDESHAEYVKKEVVGLRRSFFQDSVPEPWWKGLPELIGDSENITYADVSKQVKALVQEEGRRVLATQKLSTDELQASTSDEQTNENSNSENNPSWFWHPLFFLEHFLSRGAGAGKNKEYFRMLDGVFDDWQKDNPLPKRYRHKSYTHSSFVDQISPQIEVMAILYLQLFTWSRCRQVVCQGIRAAYSRDIKESDDAVGFDFHTPNFGWFLYAKDVVKRYLALVHFDRHQTVQPQDDNPAKPVVKIKLPSKEVRDRPLVELRNDPELRHVLTPPTMYLRWFLFAVRYYMGRSNFEVPEYLKKWAVSEFGAVSHARDDTPQNEHDTSGGDGETRQEANVFAALGLAEEELGPGF